MPNCGGVQRVNVALVGQDRQHAATGIHRRRGGLGEAVCPLLPRQGLPDGAGGAAVGQCGKELLAAHVGGPGGGVDGFDGKRRRLRGGLLFDVGVPRRDGQP